MDFFHAPDLVYNLLKLTEFDKKPKKALEKYRGLFTILKDLL